MSELQLISVHIHERLTSIHRLMDLSAAQLPRLKMKKLGQELLTVDSLLEQLETCVNEQKIQLQQLKKLEESFQTDLVEVQHLQNHIPAHLPKKKHLENTEAVLQLNPTPAPEAEPQKNSRAVRHMEFISTAEFNLIPQYMRGRVSYEQVNAVVRCFNSAVSAKYRIIHQSVKSLNNQSRRLQQRFKEQENKDTTGQYFVVDQDIHDFTQMKVDKRFLSVVHMLRHCRRLRELRGGGVTRYVVS
ncbi:SKA complex subunit 1 isoform X2 [Sphaeramia orbicularis]|uniref:SKA complex subunit 1 isoform X2 n=1 Tax=Sphaeramia orbicularis TaxID=375764 RepID=UPI00117F18BC|nr:spindle and kinetochore-associated protein 1 isoform X2 [Sphaeramia orbicularis]